jgi:hypothetical protein
MAKEHDSPKRQNHVNSMMLFILTSYLIEFSFSLSLPSCESKSESSSKLKQKKRTSNFHLFLKLTYQL